MIVVPTLQCGGSEKYVSMLCNGIDGSKFETILLIINNTDQFYTVTNPVITIIDLQVKRIRYSLFPIRKIVQENQPDIVYTTANHLNLLLATFRWLFPKHTRFIARESSLVSANSKRSDFPMYQKLIKRFYCRLDHIICQSKAMQDDLVQHFNIALSKTTVIYNPVSLSSDVVLATNKQPYTFITVARLSAEKGIARVIKAVAALTYDFRYYIIGDGDQRQALEKLVTDMQLQGKVFFQGQQQEPFAGLRHADLFLFGSYYEGFPNAVLEAIGWGIPVVAFDGAGGLNEIISNGENGLLVKTGDPETFVLVIEEALSRGFDRKGIMERTRKKYAASPLIKQVEDLFIYHATTKALNGKQQ